MSDMTPEAALALRKPFPPEMVGRLPKGGAMLDYVGHAAVVDRLLTVDPEWTWEPFAVDANGLPALDKAGNLWIRLTICGMTRIGVGDGKNMKECIGDALRNAAMRFGVALDLWAKENLVEFAQAAQAHQSGADRLRAAVAPAAESPAVAEERADTQPVVPMTPKTRATMFALLTEQGITDANDQRAGIAKIIGRDIKSRSELTEPEAAQVVTFLRNRAKA